MRLWIASLLLFASLRIAAAAEPATFPYKAKLNTEGVYVRSGPGNNYYPTDKLDTGREVEVYRHDPGGWCAIRPPEGSFTWIASRYLELGPQGLATIKGDHVAARVGSRFSDIRDVIQVRLEKGEQVEVLETKTIAGDTESPSWCKIAPPSGEFRWISAKYLDTPGTVAGIRKSSAAGNPLLPAGEGASPQPLPPTGTATAEPAASMRRLSPEEYQAELDRLNIAVSNMLVEEPSVWECGTLSARAEELLGQASTAVERGRARLLVDRLQQAQDIKERYATIMTARVDAERQSRMLSDLGRVRGKGAVAPSASGAGVPTVGVADRRFDGTGRLTRVVPKKLGAPQFALVDEKGRVRCYVTPAPGVNLQYYVGHQVGVNGVRGFMPEQKAEHVMAKHITGLDSTLTR